MKTITRILALVGAGAGALALAQSAWQQHNPRPRVPLGAAMRAQAIDTLATRMNEYYVFPEKARQIDALLRQRHRAGAYDTAASGAQLARMLSADMASVAHDLHLTVAFSAEALPPAARPPAFMRGIDAISRQFAPSGVDKAEILAANIGYLKMTGFTDADLAAPKYGVTMDKLAGTQALVIDLRGNRGGSPDAVGLLISYFVDQRTRLNDQYVRETGVTQQMWTRGTLEGKRYGARKHVAILIDARTCSAGEDFAYTMQALGRATLVGERSCGAAHPTETFRLTDHFRAAIPIARSISPITGTNWEGVGVIPDIAAAPAGALAVATAHLLRHQPR